MGQACMICPGCGFKECGTNVCPSCGLMNDNGIIRRAKAEYLLCPECGHAETGCHFYCPRCKDGVMRIADNDGVRHIWNGTELTCRHDGRVRVTRMDPVVASEIPYCPFCQEELSEHPMLHVGSKAQLQAPVQLQAQVAMAMVLPVQR